MSSLAGAETCYGIVKDHILLSLDGTFHAVPMDLASWDIRTRIVRRNPRILQSGSLAELTARLEQLEVNQSGHVDEPLLVDTGHNGFDTFHYQSRYFAIPTGASFDIERFRNGRYQVGLFGHTLEDLRAEIGYLSSGPGTRVLFVAPVGHAGLAGYMERLGQHRVTVLTSEPTTALQPGVNRILWSVDLAGLRQGQAIETEALSALSGHRFDLVAIPYELLRLLSGALLERLMATAGYRLLLMSPGGDRFYRGEDIHRIHYNQAYIDSMLKHVGGVRGKRVLEVGASDGLACDLLLASQPAEAVGVDTVDLVGCGYRHPNIRYQRVAGSALPFADASFDVAFSIATLEHVRDPLESIREMKRVTVRGGHCYLQAGPLFHSPFGHHMFGYFDDYPWIHLRLSADEIVDEIGRRGLTDRIRQERAQSPAEYVHGMLDVAHINGRTLSEYGLDALRRDPEVDVVWFHPSIEGDDLLTKEIESELEPIPRGDLIAHGFELVFRKR